MTISWVVVILILVFVLIPIFYGSTKVNYLLGIIEKKSKRIEDYCVFDLNELSRFKENLLLFYRYLKSSSDKSGQIVFVKGVNVYANTLVKKIRLEANLGNIDKFVELINGLKGFCSKVNQNMETFITKEELNKLVKNCFNVCLINLGNLIRKTKSYSDNWEIFVPEDLNKDLNTIYPKEEYERMLESVGRDITAYHIDREDFEGFFEKIVSTNELVMDI